MSGVFSGFFAVTVTGTTDKGKYWEKTYWRGYKKYSHEQENDFIKAAIAQSMADAKTANVKLDKFPTSIDHPKKEPEGKEIPAEKFAAEREPLSLSERIACERIAFIESLELSEHPTIRRSLAEQKPTADVCGGSAVSFVSNVSDQMREDVLNSTLLAQLAANAKFSKTDDPINWYKAYLRVLENIFWTISEFTFTQYSSRDQSFKLDKVIIDILMAICAPEAEGILIETLKVLSSSSSGGALSIFSQQSSHGKKGNFQLGLVTADKDNPVFSVAAAYFEATQDAGNFLFISWNNQTLNMSNGTQKMVLDTAMYDRVRDQIKSKLGQKAKDFITDLPLSDGLLSRGLLVEEKSSAVLPALLCGKKPDGLVRNKGSFSKRSYSTSVTQSSHFFNPWNRTTGLRHQPRSIIPSSQAMQGRGFFRFAPNRMAAVTLLKSVARFIPK